MKTIVQAMQLTFYDKKNVIIGIIAAIFFGAIFVLSSGMVTFFPEGPFIDLNFLRLATLFALIILSGLVVPMQLFAIRKARNSLKTTAGGLGGILTGVATMSCCTPLLLPALLSFLGFSGTQLLFFNMSIRQYALPLSLISIGLLFLSLMMVSRSIVAACRIDLRRTK